MAKAKELGPGTSWWLAPAFLGLAALLGWLAFSLNAETHAASSAHSRRAAQSAGSATVESRGRLGARTAPAPRANWTTQEDSAPRSALAHAEATPVASPEQASRLTWSGPRDEVLFRRLENLVANAMADARRRDPKAGQSAVSYRVVDLADRRILAERQPEASLTPASNLKLLTTFAALRRAGLDGRFRTGVGTDGTLSGGVLDGDLIVTAGGDPLFDQEDATWGERRLAELARSVRAAGVTRVRGDLIADLSGFADAGPAPGWPKPEGHWTSSYALAAGLTVQGGMLRLTVHPAAAGGNCALELHPAPTGLSGSRQVRSVSSAVNDVRIGSIESALRLDVKGSYGAKLPPFTTDFRHADPPRLFLHVFREALERAGVAVEGELRGARVDGYRRELGSLTTPLAHYLRPVNRDSENSVAEALLLWLARERSGLATRENGFLAVREQLAQAGASADLLAPNRFHMAGGSGLSRDNRVTTALLTETLALAASLEPALAEAYVASLAAPGEGTLDKRLTDPETALRVRAKSGWIGGASSLSGFVESPGGPLAFSIVINYPRELGGFNTSVWKPLHDAIVTELCAWEGRP